MSYEVLVKRTVWVAECPHDKKIADQSPARERYCSECSAWIPYVEISYTGKDLFV